MEGFGASIRLRELCLGSVETICTFEGAASAIEGIKKRISFSLVANELNRFNLQLRRTGCRGYGNYLPVERSIKNIRFCNLCDIPVELMT